MRLCTRPAALFTHVGIVSGPSCTAKPLVSLFSVGKRASTWKPDDGSPLPSVAMKKMKCIKDRRMTIALTARLQNSHRNRIGVLIFAADPRTVRLSKSCGRPSRTVPGRPRSRCGRDYSRLSQEVVSHSRRPSALRPSRSLRVGLFCLATRSRKANFNRERSYTLESNPR
jgi:hypothetical protein